MNQNTIEKKKNFNKRKLTNVIMAVMLLIVFASGVMICFRKDSMALMGVHKLSSIIFVICCIVHMLQYRKRKEKRYVS